MIGEVVICEVRFRDFVEDEDELAAGSVVASEAIGKGISFVFCTYAMILQVLPDARQVDFALDTVFLQLCFGP